MSKKWYWSTDGKRVGQLDGSTYVKHISGLTSFCRKIPGITTDIHILKQLTADGCTDHEVRDKDTGDVYRCSHDTFIQYGEITPWNRTQLVLPFKHWFKGK